MTPQPHLPSAEQNDWMLGIVRKILASKLSDRPNGWLEEANELALKVCVRIWNQIGMLPTPPPGHSWVLFIAGTRFALTSWHNGELAMLENKTQEQLEAGDKNADGQVLRVAMEHSGYASNYVLVISLPSKPPAGAN